MASQQDNPKHWGIFSESLYQELHRSGVPVVPYVRRTERSLEWYVPPDERWDVNYLRRGEVIAAAYLPRDMSFVQIFRILKQKRETSK